MKAFLWLFGTGAAKSVSFRYVAGHCCSDYYSTENSSNAAETFQSKWDRTIVYLWRWFTTIGFDCRECPNSSESLWSKAVGLFY